MEDCVFCKIVSGAIPSKKVYEDEHAIAFHDVNPQARVHVLVVPKRHVSDILDADRMDDAEIARLLRVAAIVAGRLGLHETGFRLVSNCGKDACQTVQHLHIHVLGGEQLSGSMA